MSMYLAGSPGDCWHLLCPLCFVAIRACDWGWQRAIVAKIETEQALVNANRELIRRMEAKIKSAVDRVWGSDVQEAAGASTAPAEMSLAS